MTRWFLFFPLALFGCGLGDVGEGVGEAVGCTIGGAIVDSLSGQPYAEGDEGILVARHSCSGLLFNTCGTAVAADATEDFILELVGGSGSQLAIESSNSDVFELAGFGYESGCGDRTGTLSPTSTGTAFLRLVGAQGGVDEVPIEIAEPFALESFYGAEPAVLTQGAEWILAVELVDEAGRGLTASTGFRWQFSPPIVEATSDSTGRLIPVVATRVGQTTATVEYGALSVSFQITVEAP